MTLDLPELLEIATDLARSAGEIVRQGASRRFTVTTKSSATDPVTEIDKATESFLVDAILSRRPDDGLLGEEGASVESKTGVTWIIDPIDGTTNFIYGIPAYAVSVGVAIDGMPAAGAVYNVALDEMFTARAGGGAFLNGQPIRANQTSDFSTALIATGFAYLSTTRVSQADVLAKLLPNIRDVRRLGSAALDLCHVACGRVDAYYETGVHPWDVTAGSVILAEAGGMVTAWDGGVATNDVIAACSRPIYEELLPYVS